MTIPQVQQPAPPVVANRRAGVGGGSALSKVQLARQHTAEIRRYAKVCPVFFFPSLVLWTTVQHPVSVAPRSA